MASEREDGYYWIRLRNSDKWQPAEFRSDAMVGSTKQWCLLICASSAIEGPHDGLVEVGERIVRDAK